VHASTARLLDLTLPKPSTTTSQSDKALNQLLDLFVSTPQDDAYDYLSYVLASLSGTSAKVREYFLRPQSYDGVVPLSKIFVFTDHKSTIRRRGVASTLKNVCFEVSAHPALLALPSQETAAQTADDSAASPGKDGPSIDLLPYILLPLAGSETYSDDDMEGMLPDLQLLPPDKEREPDTEILVTHLESLTLLTTTRAGRDRLREVKVYPIVRECHSARGSDEGIAEAAERLVNMLMRDEEDAPPADGQLALKNVDADREIEEVF
jgi:hypothetical protein